MTYDEMIAVLQAAKNGEAIESRAAVGVGDWIKLITIRPSWNFAANEYRVAPKPRTFWAVELKGGGLCLPQASEAGAIAHFASITDRFAARVIKLVEAT